MFGEVKFMNDIYNISIIFPRQKWNGAVCFWIFLLYEKANVLSVKKIKQMPLFIFAKCACTYNSLQFSKMNISCSNTPTTFILFHTHFDLSGRFIDSHLS